MQSLRKHISITSLLSTAFLAYMSYSFYTLYRVAVPPIPSITNPDGSSKPVLVPLWGTHTHTLELTLATSMRRDGGEEVRLLTQTGLAYGWDTHFDLDVNLEILWSEAAAGTGLATVGTNGQFPDLPPFPRPRDPVGIRAVCASEYGVVSAACVDATRRNASGAAPVAGNGTREAPVLGEWRGRAARRFARALQAGADVYAHVVVRVDLGPGDRPLPEYLRTLISTAQLTTMASYVPPKQVRYLWEDVWGNLTAAKYHNATVNAALPATSPLILRAENRNPAQYNQAEGRAPEAEKRLPVSGKSWPHWLGQVDVKLVMDTVPLPRDDLPPQIAGFLRTDPMRIGYAPVLAANPVRPTRERFHPLNITVSALPLRVTYAPLTIGSWQLLRVLDQAISTQKQLGATDNDTDDVIRLFAETPVWLLGITLVVSCIHMLFDVLALKNDIAFWSNTKSLRGISVRTLSTQFVSQAIISVYLWKEGASLLVLVPQVAFTVLQVWKIAKASGLGTQWRYGLPLPRYDAELAASANESQTSEIDAQAVSFMSSILIPIVLGFAAYSFVYQQYTGWVDFALSTAVSAVYTFGFVLMTPQLWINFKLKSVAHMPWRVLAYRFFNTIIDDLFASIIKMPMMHRISVFRDDIIFVIYMYQRWLYPVDASRPAEGYDVDESHAETAASLTNRAKTASTKKDK